jgi:hypothetical protein
MTITPAIDAFKCTWVGDYACPECAGEIEIVQLKRLESDDAA